ncbi:Sensory box histidine kinase, partial [hydrothermal vent metagenome]
MKKTGLLNTNRKSLKRMLLLCFFSLLVPASILIHHTYKQLELEAYYQYRVLAEELTSRINKNLDNIISEEEKRAFTDYSFLNVSGDQTASLLQRSPLSAYPVKQSIPGIISYFQVDSNGVFSTPLLPPETTESNRFGIDNKELSERKRLHTRAYHILLASKIVPENPIQNSIQTSEQSPKPVVNKASSITADSRDVDFSDEKIAAQILTPGQTAYDAFDRLEKPTERKKLAKKSRQSSLGRVKDINIAPAYGEIIAKEQRTRGYQEKAKKLVAAKFRRREKNILPQQREASKNISSSDYSIKLFESEVGAFNIGMLDSGHFVLFRNVWQNEKRQIQGAIIDSEKFIQGVIKVEFMDTALSDLSKLAVAFEGNIYALFGQKYESSYRSETELTGSLLFQSRLNAPLNDMTLIYSINTLPTGAGSTIVIWTGAILLSALCVIFIFIYRLGSSQIKLVQQQQNFVSAVSHELKTPLTSIRMYGEILKEGWADEEKKKTYYHFIYDESERLSRLISNVLQLARMTRNDMPVNLKPVSVNRLIDNIKSRLSSQAGQAKFELVLKCDDSLAERQINIDEDYFIQIIINLVDNAIKFSTKADKKQIDIHCAIHQGNKL